MARLPQFSVDTGGFHNAANLLMRGAEAYSQGLLSAGHAIGGGLLNAANLREQRANRAEERAYRQQRDEESDRRWGAEFGLRQQEFGQRQQDLADAKAVDDLTSQRELLEAHLESLYGKHQAAMYGAMAEGSDAAVGGMKDVESEIQRVQQQVQGLAQQEVEARQRTRRPVGRAFQAPTEDTFEPFDAAGYRAANAEQRAVMLEAASHPSQTGHLRGGARLRMDTAALLAKRDALLEKQTAERARNQKDIDEFIASNAGAFQALESRRPGFVAQARESGMTREEFHRQAYAEQEKIREEDNKQEKVDTESDAAATLQQIRASKVPEIEDALVNVPEGIRQAVIDDFLAGKIDRSTALSRAQLYGKRGDQGGASPIDPKAAARHIASIMAKNSERDTDASRLQEIANLEAEAQAAYPLMGADARAMIDRALGRKQGAAPAQQPADAVQAAQAEWEAVPEAEATEERRQAILRKHGLAGR